MATALAINMETEPLVPTRKDSFEAETKLFKDHTHSDNEAQVYDVRRQVIARSLVPCIVEGLKSEVKESPSLLLWDDRGLSLFDAILDSPQYYPARREWALLRKAIQDIARNIPNRSRVVELGAGNMKKTELLLHTLQGQQKRVEYLACDVDESALRRGISELRARFEGSSPYITIHGLLGTYEDCAAWLNLKSGGLPTSLIWLGNSMANFTPEQASKYVQSFLSSGSSMIIALDGCQDQREIAESYEGQCNREFILNGLSNANQILDDNVFAVNDWGFCGNWDPDICMHESFYVAQRDLTVNVCGETYRFKSGETMRSIKSGKWPRAKVLEICNNAGGRVKELWMDENQSYGVYVVEKV